MKDENEMPQYWETSILIPRGIFIVVHGLNVKPSKMGTPSAEGTLVKLLLDSGYHVYRVTLKGHSGPLEDMQNVIRSDWIDDAYLQYCQAKTIAESKRLPLYLLGFSLGALVYEVLMNEETEIPVQFEKVILFSPAVAIRPTAKTVLWLRPFTNEAVPKLQFLESQASLGKLLTPGENCMSRKCLPHKKLAIFSKSLFHRTEGSHQPGFGTSSNDRSIIKSVSPEEYRAQTGASMAAYKIVFDMEESLCSASFKNCNINTIIFIDKNDEMVSTRILHKRINQYGLTNWRIYEVKNTGAVIRPRYHHLLIDNRCVSASTWQYISGTIVNFLG